MRLLVQALCSREEISQLAIGVLLFELVFLWKLSFIVKKKKQTSFNLNKSHN